MVRSHRVMFNLFKFKEGARAVAESTSVAWAMPEDATLEQLRDEMLALMSQENVNHHRMGQIYNYIVEKREEGDAGPFLSYSPCRTLAPWPIPR